MMKTKARPTPPAFPLSQTKTIALVTALLSTVVNAATNVLYQDHYDLINGKIKIVSFSAAIAASSNAIQLAAVKELNAASLLGATHTYPSNKNNINTNNNANNANANNTNADNMFKTCKEGMANLSFAHRQHKLTK